MAEYDEVATAVLERAGGLGAVKLVGWLAPLSDKVADEPKPRTGFRLFPDPQFMEWLVIPADAVLFRISGDRYDDGRSQVWIKREARVTRCQSGRACDFAELDAHATRDDPTASRPRAYP